MASPHDVWTFLESPSGVSLVNAVALLISALAGVLAIRAHKKASDKDGKDS